jgi:hypothetical protein
MKKFGWRFQEEGWKKKPDPWRMTLRRRMTMTSHR